MFVGEQLVEFDDTGVRDLGDGTKLPLEVVEILGGNAVKKLQRDEFPGLTVPRAVNDAHASLAELCFDSERFQFGEWRHVTGLL